MVKRGYRGVVGEVVVGEVVVGEVVVGKAIVGFVEIAGSVVVEEVNDDVVVKYSIVIV